MGRLHQAVQGETERVTSARRYVSVSKKTKLNINKSATMTWHCSLQVHHMTQHLLKLYNQIHTVFVFVMQDIKKI